MFRDTKSFDRVPMLDFQDEIAHLEAELHSAIQRVLASGQFVLGSEAALFEEEVADFLGVRHAIGVNSGTDALQISLKALEIGLGDEVITTPFTFFATAEAICNVGAKPVFVDIDEDNYNLDPALIAEAITPRTKAIIPVHLYGRPCDMNPIMRVAKEHGLYVIEDAAQSFGARYYDTRGGVASAGSAPYTGTIGHLGAFSFYPTKNLGAYGDAGMVVTNNDELALLARKLRTHGSIVPYQNEMLGYNSRLDELQAAILRVKLPHVPIRNAARRNIAMAYNQALATADGIKVPDVISGHVFHQYTISVPEKRDHVRSALEDGGITSAVYYPIPLHQMSVFPVASEAMPHAEAASRSVLSLPVPFWKSGLELDRLVERVSSAVNKAILED